MEKRKARFLPFLASFSVFSSCVLSFLLSMPALPAAAAEQTVTLTPAQTRALFGDTVSYTYYDGMDYQTGTATYLNVGHYSGTGNIDHYDSLSLSGQWIVYQSSTQHWVEPGTEYFSVQLSPSVSLYGLNSFSMGIGCTIASRYTNGELESVDTWRTSTYPLNYVEYSVSGDPFQKSCAWYHASPTVQMPYISYAEFLLGNSQTPVCFRLAPVDFTSQVFSSISDISFTAQHATYKNIGTNGPGGYTYFIIQCPTLSATYSVGDGGETGSDLTATNQKLDNIIAILSMIASQSGGGSDESYLDQEKPADQSSQNQAEGNFNSEYSSASADQQRIDSVVNHGNLDSVVIGTAEYSPDPAFNGLWNDGSGGTNPLILAMCLIPISIAVLSYILFGKRM